jgi:hypothetical protein
MSRLRAVMTIIGALAGTVVLGACGTTAPARSALLEADAAAAAPNPLAVSPLPGTPDASASSQISFLGPSGTRVLAVRVLGSRSGAHAGVLRRYSTGTGESFLPARPFAPGERVTVRARVRIGALTRVASTAFTVARQAPILQKQFPLNPGDPKAVQHYISAPALAPSTVRITTAARPGAAPGLLMLAPYQGRGAAGPMIVDQSGGLVWFHQLAREVTATNLGVQEYEGRPVLVWWQGRVLQLGFGQGENVLYDSSYRQIARVRAGNGYSADLHEVRLTPQGTAWIDAFNPVRMNLASAGGVSGGSLSDSIIQEVDVKSGLVMWEWHALGHIAAGESKNPVPGSSYPWDYAHVNSVDPGPSGDVLLSARNTWALYDVDIRSGNIRWRLGGVRSSFRLGPGAQFFWQHDAEFQPNGLISLFDNGSDPPKEKQSRGVLLAPNAAAHTVALVKALTNPRITLLAESQGNMLSLPGGAWLLGYGRLPNFTEFDSAGNVLLDGTLGREVQNFKTTLAQWSGRPAAPPALAAQPLAGGGMLIAASWNGATDVATWRVLAGASPGSLTPVATAARTGFETRITVSAARPYVSVQALDAAGAVIGSSAAIKA